MNKIPVGKTVAFAYNFLFTRFGTVVGIAALPALLAATVDYLVRSYISTEDTSIGGGHEPADLDRGHGDDDLHLGRHIGWHHPRGAWARRWAAAPIIFPVGMVELRMFGAMLRFWLGVVVLLFLASLLSGVAFHACRRSDRRLAGAESPRPRPSSRVSSPGRRSATRSYTIVRMGFLLSPTVVSEDKAGLQRSHDLSRGNFWRIVAIVLALILPILVPAVDRRRRHPAGRAWATTMRRMLEDDGMDELIRRGEEAIAQNSCCGKSSTW